MSPVKAERVKGSIRAFFSRKWDRPLSARRRNRVGQLLRCDMARHFQRGSRARQTELDGLPMQILDETEQQQSIGR